MEAWRELSAAMIQGDDWDIASGGHDKKLAEVLWEGVGSLAQLDRTCQRAGEGEGVAIWREIAEEKLEELPKFTTFLGKAD